MPPPQALAIAQQKGLDLVEISPTAVPPVCRIMDFGKYQYQEQKRAREAKKHQKVIEVKEIKFRPKVDEHDYQFKKKHIERFLADGDKVKATIFFRGREMAHPGDRPPHPRAADRRAGRRRDRRDDAAAGRQPDAHDPDAAGGRKRPAPKREDERTPEHESRSSRAATRSNAGAEGRDHAETEDAPRRRQALQEDRHGQVPAQQGVQAPHPDAARRRKRKRGLRGTTSCRRRRRGRSCARMLPY